MKSPNSSALPTYDEIELHIQRGRQLRAQAIRGFFRDLFAGSRVAKLGARKTAYVPRVLHGGA